MLSEEIIENTSKGMYANAYKIYLASHSTRLQEAFMEMEETYKRNYVDFAHKFRKTMEEFALTELICEKKKSFANGKFNYEIARKNAVSDAKKMGYPEILAQLFFESKREKQLLGIVQQLSHDSIISCEDKEYFFEFWRALFSFGSNNSHAGATRTEYIPDKGNCRDYLKKLTNVICAYYGTQYKFEMSNIPFLNYYPIPNDILIENKIILTNKNRIYVRKINNVNQIFLFTEQDSIPSLADKRNIEILQHLWIDNFEYPQNIIPEARFESNSNGVDFCNWIVSLPGIPIGINDDMIISLPLVEKEKICKGIIKSIMTMHNYEPPFYHRNINSQSILLFEKGKWIKPLLMNFEYAKDNSESACFTVFQNVISKSLDNSNDYFAPEIMELREGDDADWGAADIYALGTLFSKLLIDDKNGKDITEKYQDIIECMTAKDKSSRIDINFVNELF